VVVVEPEEMADAEYERVVERVCAIDVAKESGQVCVRVTRDGRRVSRLWTVMARTGAVLELGELLVAEGVQKVTVESTSDYWRIFFYLLEGCGLDVQLVNARDVKNVPGRPKTDKHDAVWLAKLTEKGMLRPSFVPPRQIRVLRDYTRMRVDLTRDRTRHWQRLEKLLEDSLIKVSAVASTLTTRSARDMIEALIAGERDPRKLAGMARGKMRSKHHALVEALTGQFDEHHRELARMLLDQIDALTGQIDTLTERVGQLLAALTEPAALSAPAGAAGQAPGDSPPNDSGPSDDGCLFRVAPPAPPLAVPPLAVQSLALRSLAVQSLAVQRLAQIPGISPEGAQTILAEIGLDMTRFLTAGHLVSWAKLCPRTIQSGATHKTGKSGKGNPYLKGVLGQAAGAAARTQTFLGERYRRIVKRRGKGKALVAVARSILVIIWHLLSDPTATYHDLGVDYHTTRLNTDRKIRNHIRQIEALGYSVALTPAA
jgi:transposase